VPAVPAPRIYVNPACSKCRTALGLLAERRVEAEAVQYLDEPPSRADLERLMGMLGLEDPRAMMRTGEPLYSELDLADADRDVLLDAVTQHPILLERPIVVVGERAVVARPPERLLELL
jgi:arsenate reductase (glutaredoxin)